MQATLFEFRHRWWVIFFIIFAAFASYQVDHLNSGMAIADGLARRAGTTAGQAAYRLVFAAGALAIAFAGLLRSWGTAYLRAEVMRDRKVHSERLVADGPYRYVRNPLYTGNILLAAGVGLMASRTGFFVLLGGMTLFVLRLIGREEAELRRGQGESYRQYCAAVPRLLPSLRPRVPAGGNRPQWVQAIAAESMYWLFALAMAAFAATLNMKVFWIVFIVGTAAAWLLWRFGLKKSESPAAD